MSEADMTKITALTTNNLGCYYRRYVFVAPDVSAKVSVKSFQRPPQVNLLHHPQLSFLQSQSTSCRVVVHGTFVEDGPADSDAAVPPGLDKAEHLCSSFPAGETHRGEAVRKRSGSTPLRGTERIKGAAKLDSRQGLQL